MTIRPENAVDHTAIRAVEMAAFGRPVEADLVDALRRAGDAVFSLVAAQAGQIVGHAMFSRMDAPFRALGLGPVAVRPDWQRRGIGGRLVCEGLARAGAAGWVGVFVLGDPAYYRRFDFDAGRASGFASPYAGPHLMALTLGADELPVRSGRIDYAPAFAALG